MSNADLLAVMLIGFALLCFIRAARGSFKPGFGVAYIDPVRLKGTERGTYFALGIVLTAVGIWIVVR